MSTNVGGVPEILPPDMLLLAEPDPRGMDSEPCKIAVEDLDGCSDCASSPERVGQLHAGVFKPALRNMPSDDCNRSTKQSSTAG